MDTIKTILIEYKNLTIEMLNCIDESTKLQNAIVKRQILLEELKNIDINAEEMKRLFEELEIEKLDQKLNEKIKNEMKKTKESIRNLGKMRNVQRNYYKHEGTATFFEAKT